MGKSQVFDPVVRVFDIGLMSIQYEIAQVSKMIVLKVVDLSNYSPSLPSS